MSMLRKIFSYITFGALVGIAASTFWGPKFLEWRQSSGVKDAMCQCTELVRVTARNLVELQLYGAAGGAVVFAIAGLLVQRSLGKRRERKLAAAAAEKAASQINPPTKPV